MITCVLLKYRVTNVGPYPKSGPFPELPMALEDAQRTVVYYGPCEGAEY